MILRVISILTPKLSAWLQGLKKNLLIQMGTQVSKKYKLTSFTMMPSTKLRDQATIKMLVENGKL